MGLVDPIEVGDLLLERGGLPQLFQEEEPLIHLIWFGVHAGQD